MHLYFSGAVALRMLFNSPSHALQPHAANVCPTAAARPPPQPLLTALMRPPPRAPAVCCGPHGAEQRAYRQRSHWRECGSIEVADSEAAKRTELYLCDRFPAPTAATACKTASDGRATHEIVGMLDCGEYDGSLLESGRLAVSW